MIKFDKLFKIMEEKGISQYRMIKYYGISASQIHRMRKGKGVSTYTLNRILNILKDCKIEDILEWIPDPDDEFDNRE